MSIYSTLGWTLFALITAPILIGVCLRAPKLVALGMLAILFTFSSSTWGQLNVENTIYARGTGQFYFSLLNLILWVAGIGLLLRRLANPYQPQLAGPISLYFFGFVMLLMAHVLVGNWIGIAMPEILDYTGILNVLNMLIFMYLIITAFRAEQDPRRLMNLLILLAALRAVFGIVRFIWFDGDSANPYRNFERMDLKIVFFDIADNFIASIGAFWAAWLLSMPNTQLSLPKRLILVVFLLVEVAAVAMSYRRTSLLGLALMFAFLLYRLPPARRTMFMLCAGAILLATAAMFFQQRLQFSGSTPGNLITSLIYDIDPATTTMENNRFYELWAAAQTLGDNWLIGIGTWGSFTGDQEILSYYTGELDFVHSGFGHIVLKSGVIGLFLFSGMLIAYTSHYFRRCKSLTGDARLLSDCGFAGFLFWIPTLLVGTPIIEFRTMLLMGLTLAMPFIASGLQQTRARSYAYS